MGLDLLEEKGVPLDRQVFTWRELAGHPYSKLDTDAFTRIRVILMNGVVLQSLRLLHNAARMNAELRGEMARVRRVAHFEQTMVNWLNPADQSPLETTLAYEQVAIEVTASLAQNEPDPYIAQTLRYGLLEDFDHLYRYAALADRLEGLDVGNIIQGYTDVAPGRPTIVEHRHPIHDLSEHYDAATANPLTKLNALTITAGEHQTHDFYMNVGPMYADPMGRALYAEIAAIEEQHVTQYESLLDPRESLLEKWLLQEATEVYNFWGCLRQESHPRIKQVWERCLGYELGQMHFVADLFRRIDGRDPAEVLPRTLPEPIRYESQRDFVRKTLETELRLCRSGTRYVDEPQEPSESREYRNQLNREGSPSETVAEGWVWVPGTELTRYAANGGGGRAGRMQGKGIQ
jgi:hypothetical protein